MQLQGRNLQSGLSGEDVAALHRELMFLGYTIPEDERRGWFFGAGTAQAVAAFQQAYRLRASGIVDTPTAQALGHAVAAVGTRAKSPPTREYPAPVVEDQPPAAPKPPAPGASPRGAEFAGPEPPAAPHRGDQPTDPAQRAGEGDEPQPVTRPTASESLTELAGESDAAEEGEAAQDQATGQTDAEAVQGLEEEDQDSGAQPESDQDDGGVGDGDDGGGSDDGEDEPSLTELEGRLISDRGISAEGVTLRFYERGFGGRARPLGGTVTAARGRFSISVRLSGRKGTRLDVVAEGPDDEEIRLVVPGRRIDPSKPVKLVITADKLSSPHQSEHDRLAQVLAPHLGDIKLSEAKEDDEQQDITLLHEATGWDARLIALGASAAKLAEESEIAPKALYGMLRAGLPTRKNQLVQVTKAGVGHALRKAVDAGVVAFDEQEIEAAQDQFEQYARRERRHLAAPGTPSSYGALLKATGLGQAQQDQVDEILTGHTGDPEELWEKTEAAGLPTDQLKLTAQVAALTSNSARLVESLRERAGSSERLGQSLVNDRLYEPGAWADRLRELANGNETVLGKMIPPAYEAENLDKRLGAYTADLAREVQTSYPTRVLGRKVATGELQLRDIPIGVGLGDDEDETGGGQGAETRAGDADDAAAPPPPPLASEQVRENVAMVLERAADRDFELGVTPLHQFLNEHNEELFTGISQEHTQVATRQVETLQRLYQITPSDGALQALEESGFASAHQIAEVPRERFLQRFGDRFASQVEADLTWARAQQVDAVTLNMATTVKQSISDIGGRVLRSPSRRDLGVVQVDNEDVRSDIEDAVPQPDDQGSDIASLLEGLGMSPDELLAAQTIKQFPTLEGLFQSLDYPECDHCESVLSPAAYFVDLLRFLDRDPKKGRRPYDALTDRRPDLPNVTLTCDNTETALPYIDIVNETLEQYVFAGELFPEPHDNEGLPSEDLIAEPQHVFSEAYGALKQARYPLELPFDLWLETVRAFARHFDTPFWQILDALRPADELHPSGDEEAYGRAAVAYERLGFAPEDVAVLTDGNPLAGWPELFGAGATPGDVDVSDLANAKTLARRLGVSYRELVDLVQTAFVNPKLDVLAALRRFNVPTAQALHYLSLLEARRALVNAVDQGDATSQMQLEVLDRQIQAHEAQLGPIVVEGFRHLDQSGDLSEIVVLSDPEIPQRFDNTTLQTADGSAASPMMFVLLNHFVRIWRRLGWSIEEVDRALTGLLRGSPGWRTPEGLGPAMATALVELAQLEQLTELLGTGRQGRTDLLALWSPLDRYRYEELFAGPGTWGEVHVLGATQAMIGSLPPELASEIVLPGQPSQPEDDDADEPGGSLSVGSEGPQVTASVANLGALRAALGLTSEEMRQVLVAVGHNPEPESLSLETVSILYRHGLLGRLLGLSVTDLLTLVWLSGVDPFMPLAPPVDSETGGADTQESEAGASTYRPLRNTLRFVELVRTTQDSGLSVEELDYLLRHRFDPIGPYRHANRPPLELVRSLAAEISRIRTEHAVPADPLAFTDERVARELALVLEPEVAATFLDLWTGVRRLGSAEGTTPSGDPAAGGSNGLVHPSFVADHLARRMVDGVGWVGFLATEDLDLDAFFTPTPTDQDKERSRRHKLATDFLPYLQERLIHRLVVDTVAASVTSEPELVRMLLADHSVLDDPEHPGRPLLDAYVEAGSHGLTEVTPDTSPEPAPNAKPDPGTRPDSGTRPDPSGRPGAGSVAGPGKPSRPAADAGPVTRPIGPTRPAAGGRPDPAGEPATPQITGYLEVPASGRYRISVRCPQPGIEVMLAFADRPDPLIRAEATKEDLEPAAVVELRAGLPYSFTLDQSRAKGGGAVTLWLEGAELPKRQVTEVVTYPRAQVERLHRLHMLVTKALHLVDGLGLTEPELRHMARHPEDFDGLDLGELPVRLEDATGQRAQTLFRQVIRLAGWAQLRETLRAEPQDLVDLVSRARRNLAGESSLPSKVEAHQAAQAALDDLYQQAGMVMRREPKVVQEAAGLLGMTAGIVDGQVEAPRFASELGLRKLWRVLALAHRLGVDPKALGRWATPTPDQEVARDVRAAVKARFQPDAWRRVVQPISDELRKRKRDALVAYILHTEGFDRMEQLFEYFLLDPGTEPVVQTSRLRLAISSVQTFIQRCFLGLEVNDKDSSKSVHPSALDAEQWEWMKRYRVWEANRKIFLWPENWLEPELRDEKSPLFSSMESQLLETDLDEEHAEVALTQYLRGLEEVARLDVRSVYEEGRSGRVQANVPLKRVHVLARTFNEPHKYFYRTRANRKWSPWLPVEADITGDQVTLAYWNNRVQLFWMTFLDKPIPKKEGSGLSDLRPELQDRDYLLHWTDYHQGAWSDPVVHTFSLRQVSVGHADPRNAAIRAYTVPPGTRLGYKTYAETEMGIVESSDLFGTLLLRPNKAYFNPFRWDINPSYYDDPILVPYFSIGEDPTVAVSPGFRGEGLKIHPSGWTGNGSLGVQHQVEKVFDVEIDGQSPPDDQLPWRPAYNDEDCPPNQNLLRKSVGPFVLTIAHDARHPGRPYFYADSRHSFFVEPIWRETSSPTGSTATAMAMAGAPVIHMFDGQDDWENTAVSAVTDEGTPLPPILEIAGVEPELLSLPVQRDVITRPEAVISFDDKQVTSVGSKPVHLEVLKQIKDRPQLVDQIRPGLISELISVKDLQ